MGDGGDEPHLVYAAGETSYPKKLRRYFIGSPRHFGETTAVSQRLDDGLDPNVIWTQSDCAEEKNPQWPSDCNWQSFSTPLHRALRMSDMDSVELLLSRGANVNIHNANGLTPLHESVWRLEHDDIRFLIEHGCDLDSVTIAAPERFDDEDIDLSDQPNLLPTQLALINADDIALRLLVEAGARLHISPDNETWTILDLALLASDYITIQMLLSMGVGFSLALPSGTYNPVEPTTADQESAKHLLETAQTNNVSPADCHYLTYVHALQEAQKRQHLNGDSGEETIRQFIEYFFESLQLLAYGVVERDTKFCDACVRFQIESAKIYKMSPHDQELVIPLNKNRNQLEESAASGCLLCAKIADELDFNFRPGRYDTWPAEHYETTEARAQLSISLRIVYYTYSKDISIDVKRSELSLSLSTGRVEDTSVLDADVGDPLDADTASESAIHVAKGWLHTCKTSQDHLICQAAYQSPTVDGPMPWRLLHIGQENGTAPRLIDTNGKHFQFCALSYCWGRESFIKTTKGNLGLHERAIDLASLPILLRQSVDVARQLAFKYIWIDALCIIQDDDTDWEREASRMDSIYSHAELTISPLASSSVNDSLIRPRIMRMTRPLALDLMWQPKRFRKRGRRFVIFAPDFDYKAGYEQGPVHSRGWTLQEQLLSSRILWFAQGMLHYQCLYRYHKEDDPKRLNKGTSPETGRFLSLFKTKRTIKDVLDKADALSSVWHTPQGSFELWQRQLEEFTRRHLTMSSDRLPAFYAVSRKMAAVEKKSFTAGIWEGEQLLESLCWRAQTPYVREQSSSSTHGSFPSWSWISVPGEISFSWVRRDSRQSVKIIPAVEILSLNAPTHTQTQTKPAHRFASPLSSMTIKTTLYKKKPLSTALLDIIYDGKGYTRPELVGMDYTYGSIKQDGDIYAIRLFSFPRGPRHGVINGRYSDYRGTNPTSLSMLVQRIKGTSNGFRRIGITVENIADDVDSEQERKAALEREAEPSEDMLEDTKISWMLTKWVKTDMGQVDDYVLELW